MSVTERNSYHEHAEDQTLATIGIFIGLIVGGGYWFVNSDEISWWLGALITIFAAGFFYVTRNLFSRLFRGLGYGLGWGILLIVLGWVAHIILNMIDPSILLMGSNEGEDTEFSTGAHTLLGITGLVIGLWNEFTGDHHAYGGPVAPREPSPPSP